MDDISPSDSSGNVYAWNTQTHVLQQVSSNGAYTIAKTIHLSITLPTGLSNEAKAGLAGYSFPVEVDYSALTTAGYKLKLKSGNADLVGGNAFADTPADAKWNVVFDANGDFASGNSVYFIIGFDGDSAGNTWSSATLSSAVESANIFVKAQ